MTTKKTAYARNLVALFVWQGSNYIAPLITLPYLARVLGPEAMGSIAVAVSVVAYFVLLTEWGFNLTSSREIAQSAGDQRKINLVFWDTLAAKSLNGLISIGVLTGLGIFIPDLRAIAPVLAAASVAVVANVVTVNWFLQGVERLDVFAGFSLAAKLATIPLTFLLVRESSDAWLACLIQTGTSLCSGLISLYLAKNLRLIGSITVSINRTLASLKSGWHVVLSHASVNLYTTTNIVILSGISGSTAVGHFSGADRLRLAASGVMTPIVDASYPRVARLMQEDRTAGYAFVRKLALFQGGLALCISLGLFVLAEPLVYIILGEQFSSSVNVLRVLAWVPLLSGLSNVFAFQVLLQTGYHRVFSAITIAAAPISLAIVFPLTSAFSEIGTAATFVIVELLVFIAILLATLRTNPGFLGKTTE